MGLEVGLSWEMSWGLASTILSGTSHSASNHANHQWIFRLVSTFKVSIAFGVAEQLQLPPESNHVGLEDTSDAQPPELLVKWHPFPTSNP